MFRTPWYFSLSLFPSAYLFTHLVEDFVTILLKIYLHVIYNNVADDLKSALPYLVDCIQFRTPFVSHNIKLQSWKSIKNV